MYVDVNMGRIFGVTWASVGDHGVHCPRDGVNRP